MKQCLEKLWHSKSNKETKTKNSNYTKPVYAFLLTVS